MPRRIREGSCKASIQTSGKDGNPEEMKKKIAMLILAAVVALEAALIITALRTDAQTKNTKEITFQPLPEDMDIKLQEKVFTICKEEGVSFPLVMAIIKNESNFAPDTIGEDGDSGLMQVVPKWHEKRIEKMGITDIMEPIQNVRVGVNYLAECLKNHPGNTTIALIAYNMGEERARELEAQGVYESEYSTEIEETMDMYNEWMEEYEEQ